MDLIFEDSNRVNESQSETEFGETVLRHAEARSVHKIHVHLGRRENWRDNNDYYSMGKAGEEDEEDAKGFHAVVVQRQPKSQGGGNQAYTRSPSLFLSLSLSVRLSL